MSKSIFITGTDTGVGKTIISGLLARFLWEKDAKVITQKWIQTGSSAFSEDIATHLELMKMDKKEIEQHVPDIAPYVLKFPASPHLAAEIENISIDTEKIKNSFYKLKGEFDFVLVEGSGGLNVPVNDKTLIVDIVEEVSLPVIVVVPNRLGAINQTLLTVDALKQKGIPIVGIIFNRLSSYSGDEVVLADNRRIIEKISAVEVLGELTYSEDMDALYEAFKPIASKVMEKIKK